MPYKVYKKSSGLIFTLFRPTLKLFGMKFKRIFEVYTLQGL